MFKSVVVLFVLALVGWSLAGDVLVHPGYAGYGHGVSYRYDHRYYPYYYGFSPNGYRYGGYGYGLGDYYRGYYNYPYYSHYW